MKQNLQIANNSKGFTLVEIIVTIVAAGILGAIFVHLMGTALNASWNSVEIVRDEANGEKLMERIIGEYVALINSDPDNALSTIDDYHGQTIYGINITANYIQFDAGGNEVIIGPPPATGESLKFVLQAPSQLAPAIRFRYPLTTILTKSRTASNDQIVIY
ncbi:MAG: prepilin-type N-terminal cleavage/methylation domain-containing protein [Pseudomonadota bacterium]|nr:prepilin-type N-terminal cleavage/methylation domain-containing protein [Pseudomonadota bacterium]